MNISYNGRLMKESWDYHLECTVRHYDNSTAPFAQIFFREKEQEMFDFINSELEKSGYSLFFYDGDDYDNTSWAWYTVENMEEYRDFKELYLELKQRYKSYKKLTKDRKVYAIFVLLDNKEHYYSRTPIVEQAETCVSNLAKRGYKALIREWKGEEREKYFYI